MSAGMCCVICFHYSPSCRIPRSALHMHVYVHICERYVRNVRRYVYVLQSAFTRIVLRRKQSVDSQSFFLSFFVPDKLGLGLTLNCIQIYSYVFPVCCEIFPLSTFFIKEPLALTPLRVGDHSAIHKSTWLLWIVRYHRIRMSFTLFWPTRVHIKIYRFPNWRWVSRAGKKSDRRAQALTHAKCIYRRFEIIK